MMKKNRTEQRKVFLLLYTILFAVSCVLVFWYFPAKGKRMVWKGDGLSQHYVALCYYARWGRAVLKSVLEGHPSFPAFNMHMGFGADLFTTLQYYVIGDPFSLPAVFVPQKHMLFFHDAMIVLRMYLAGICFDSYCRTMGHRNLTGNLCGTLIYVFSSFVLFGMRHPYFLNAMIWFPLLLIGAEHIFRGRRGRLFTAAVFLACISNFYFFYMLVLMTIIYVVWRSLRICLFPVLMHKEQDKQEKIRQNPGSIADAVKRLFAFAGRFLQRAVLGTALGACFLLPILLRFMQDPRASEGVAYSMLYPKAYYKGFPESFVGFGAETLLENWTCLGVGGIGLLAVILLFIGSGGKGADKRAEKGAYAPDCAGGGTSGSGHGDLKIALTAMLVMTLLPAAGAALNGFTYPANRWIWALCMLAAYIAAVTLPFLQNLSAGRMALALLFMSVYAVICALLDAPRSVILDLVLAAAAAAIVRAAAGALKGGAQADAAKGRADGSGGRKHGRESSVSAFCCLVLTGTVVLTSALHGYVCFAKGVRFSGLEEYHTDHYIAGMMASDAYGMRSLLGNDTFYRYSGRYISNNFNLLNDVSDTQYYWSLSDSRIDRFFTETGQYNGMVHLFDNLDNRTMLDELSGVGYYKRGDGSLLPFGYEKMEGLHFDNRELFEEKADDPLPVFAFSVYKNKYTLPLGFTTDRYVTRETYDALSIPQRQEALMQGVLLEEEGLESLKERNMQAQSAQTDAGGIREAELSFTSEEVPFLTEEEEGIEISRKEDGSVQVTVLDTEACLHLRSEAGDALSQGEISVLLTGMAYAAPETLPQGEEMPEYANTDPVEVRITARRGDKTVSDREVEYTLADNPWKSGRTDFLSCCGFTEEALSGLELKFSRKGVYTFREMKIIRQPMDNYPGQAQALGEYVLEDLDLHELEGSGATDRITGRLTLPEARILCMQIPRCQGLRAYVDGEQVPLLQADTMFSAVAVEAGTHEIELRYRTPGLAAGAAISAAALLLAAAETLTGFFRRRKKS